MIKLKHVNTLFIFMLFGLYVQAQAEYDVRFLNTVGCDDSTLLVDIEVKAADGNVGFFMSEQNYRFSYNRDAIANPTITSQLLTGFVPGGPGLLGFTLYSPHNLTGSLDTVVSYNIELQGGDGAFLTPDTWIRVGQLGFDLLTPNACYGLEWHETVFPPTFVGELSSGQRFDAIGTLYGNVTDCAGCLLPMELVSFEGVTDGCRIDLSWETASEINTSHVVIQRSINGSDFKDIGEVTAAGNSTTLQSYTFSDYTMLSSDNYYRLKQVDQDGLTEYSDVIQVQTTCIEDNIGTLDVFPNPVRNNDVSMRFYSGKDTDATAIIMNVAGKVVVQRDIEVLEGVNQINLQTSKLNTGTYLIQIEGQGWRSSAEKFIKIE